MKDKKLVYGILVVAALAIAGIGLLVLNRPAPMPMPAPTPTPYTEKSKKPISCKDSLDCPLQMECENHVCVDVGCLGEGKVFPSTAVSPEGFEEAKHIATECCGDLKAIPTLNSYDENCNREPPPPGIRGGRTVCSNCGNRRCEEWETKCNCPEDCK